METTKKWWMSKTIWTSLLTALSVVLAAAGVLPPGLTETAINEIVTVVLALLTVVFRAKATATIAPLVTPAA